MTYTFTDQDLKISGPLNLVKYEVIEAGKEVILKTTPPKETEDFLIRIKSQNPLIIILTKRNTKKRFVTLEEIRNRTQKVSGQPDESRQSVNR